MSTLGAEEIEQMSAGRDEAIYPISAAAQRVGLSARTLRIYEQEDSFSPRASRDRIRGCTASRTSSGFDASRS